MSSPSGEYPPRYQPAFNGIVEGHSGFVTLITNEPEWLARPAPWGIHEHGSKRKNDLYWYYFCTRDTDWIECRSCLEIVLSAITEEGLVCPLELDVFRDRRDFANQFREWYNARHPVKECASRNILRHFAMHEGGVITHIERFNKVLEHFHEQRFSAQRRNPALHNVEKEWSRWISLELMGPNPFRPVTFAEGWRSEAAVSIASTMYESRDFAAMPVFADALEDAGCDSPNVLGHCRGPGPHVRGCWAVDLVLGRA